MLFNINSITNSTKIYKLMSQTIIPRPIAWIVTKNKDIINIAPFSYFTGLSSNPATCIVSIGHKSDNSPKDTLKNIRDTKKCTICMVDENFLEAMHNSSKELPSTISEAEFFDITTKDFFDDYPPIIDGVKVAYACSLNQEVDIGGKTIPIILNIEHIFVDDKIIDENLNIDFKPIARVGKAYASLCNLKTLKRV